MPSLTDVSPGLILLSAAALAAALRWLQLVARVRSGAAGLREGERGLRALHGALVVAHVDSGSLPEAPPVEAADVGAAYRPVPGLDRDPRLVVAHEARAVQMVLRFPRIEPGRLVLFADGRVELFAEGAVERLIAGDNVLRQRLELPEIPLETLV